MSFVSSVIFVLSLEDLIQGLGDTSWLLVEGWDGGTSGRVKSQLPRLGLGHVWGTTYIPSSLWKQALASLSMTCMISDPDWFHPFSCPASPETSLVSLGEYFNINLFILIGGIFFKKHFHLTKFSLLLRTSLFAASRGYSVIAVHCLFNPVLLLMEITGSRHSGSVVVAHRLSYPGASTIFPNQDSNAYLKYWIKRENTLEGIWNKSLLHETWYHGLFMRRNIEDCPCFKQPPEIRTDWGSPPKGSCKILKLSCHVALFLLQFLNPTLECSFQRAGLSLDSLLSIR